MKIFNPFKRSDSSQPSSVRGSSPASARGRSLRGFEMGNTDRFNSDFFSGSMTADQAVFGAIRVSRNRARWLEQNHNLTRKFLIMVKTNVVGAKGIRLQSLAAEIKGGKLIPDEGDRLLIEEAHREYSKARNFSLDTRLGRRVFEQVGMQRLIVDGECIIHKVRGADNKYRFANQMIDAELLDHEMNRKASSGLNEIRMGVELDGSGRPVAYYFLKEAPVQWVGSVAYGSGHTRVPADEIDHIFITERPGQTRGFTHLMATGQRAKMLDAIEAAVTIGYRVAASKMGFFKPNEDYNAPADSDGNPVDSFGGVPADCAPGEFWELPEGLDFEAFDPGYPGADFGDFTKSITRSMAAGLGVSYPEFGNDFEGVSYSAGQIGVHSDIAFWADLQQFWIDAFEEPNFVDWLPMAITSGALRLPMSKLAKFERVKFQPPSRRHIDPMKTHKAQSIALGDMSRGPFSVAAENGQDYEDVAEEFARAIALNQKLGLPIPESWGVSVELTEGENTALLSDD